MRAKVVIGTRLHLGNSSVPPTNLQIEGWVQNLRKIVEESTRSDLEIVAVIAVDATPKIVDYDYVQTLRDYIAKKNDKDLQKIIHILPVSPWGKFVPALNALVHYAHEDIHAEYILMISAEVSASAQSIHFLYDHCREVDDGQSYVLVAGAALNGHTIYDESPKSDNETTTCISNSSSPRKTHPLNGRTCPWNTLAMWNVSKLILTGFLTVSDIGSFAGIEESVAIAMHQSLFPHARAKLIRLTDIQWKDTFDDEERRQWHERKMNSKLERANIQLEMLGLIDKGRVEHI